MTDDNIILQIKPEPKDDDYEHESSSCIDIIQPLELKCEAEDEEVEDDAVKKGDFDEDLEELYSNFLNFKKKHIEELIIRKFLFSTNFKLSGPKIKFLDTMTSNLIILNDIEPISNLTIILVPIGYPKTIFESSSIKEIQNHCKKYSLTNTLKIDLRNGFISISCEKESTLPKIFDNAQKSMTFIDESKQAWKIIECDSKKLPFAVPKESSTSLGKFTISIKDLKKLKEVSPSNSINIKEEPIDDSNSLVSNVEVKEEVTEEQEETYIITELDDIKHELNDYDLINNFPETSMNLNDEDEDEFQYNTVNSFKSDLATRRSVSHTVVSEKSDKSKKEAALLAMQELKKIEQDIKTERFSGGLNQPKKAKTMSVPLNVNGIRIVTKVPLPNVSGSPNKPVKPIEEECKFQCSICFIKFKTFGQLIGHKRLHDTAKAKLNTADMTKNVYKEVKMRIEQIANRRSIHVLLPNYDYAFVVTNSTSNKLYMKCFRQLCDVKAYSTNDGKFFIKVGEKHCHGPDQEVILSKINEKKKNDFEKMEAINKSVQEAIIEKKKQKNLLEEKRNELIERIKRTQEEANNKKVVQVVKRRKL